MRRDEIIEVLQVPTAKLSQGVGYFLRIADFRSNQPKREDEGQVSDGVPFLSQVPDGMFRLLLAESDCLIADKETGSGGTSSCEPVNEAVRKFAVPRRDVLLSEPSALRSRRLHVQDARKRIPPLSSAPCAGGGAAGCKPAGPTGQRPVFRI